MSLVDKINFNKIFLILLCFAVLFSISESLAQNRKKEPVKPPDPPFKQAMDLYNKKDYAKALDILKKITTEFPDSLDAVYYVGDIYLKFGEYELGMEALKKASQGEKYKDCLTQVVYSEIPLQLFRLNYKGDELITKLANGLRFSAVIYQEKAPLKTLNEIAYPVWAEQGQVIGYGIEAGGFYNPVSLNVGYYMGEIDLKTVKKRFALPPGLPSADYPGFDYKIKVNTINISVHYTPAVVLWGYVYPSIGGCFLMGSYKHGSISASSSGIGLSAEILVKYKNLFLKGGYKKGIDDKSFDNQLSLQLGFKINMFN